MISALERLRALRAGKPLHDAGTAGPDSLPMYWRIEFEEGAAILQFDGGMTREEADVQAMKEIIERMRSCDGT